MLCIDALEGPRGLTFFEPSWCFQTGVLIILAYLMAKEEINIEVVHESPDASCMVQNPSPMVAVMGDLATVW